MSNSIRCDSSYKNNLYKYIMFFTDEFQSIHFHDQDGIMKGGVPIDKDQMHYVPLGLAYSTHPFYDMMKQEVPECIPVISDSDFNSLFSLVSTNTKKNHSSINRKTRKSNIRTTSAR